MTHLPALTPSSRPSPEAPPRASGRTPFGAPRLAVATALVCGLALAGAAPARAGTVLRGKVSVPAVVPAKADRSQGNKILATDVVIYVTEKPGSPRLAGRGKKADVNLVDAGFNPWVLVVDARSKVKFLNDSHVYHGLFSVSAAGRSEIGSLAPGERLETRFDQPGIYNL